MISVPHVPRHVVEFLARLPAPTGSGSATENALGRSAHFGKRYCPRRSRPQRNLEVICSGVRAVTCGDEIAKFARDAREASSRMVLMTHVIEAPRADDAASLGPLQLRAWL